MSIFKVIYQNFVLQLLLLAAVFSSCSGDHQKKNVTPLQIEIIRFEQELFKMDIYNIAQESEKLANRHPVFFPLYTNRIIEVGDISQKWFAEALTQFVTDQAMFEINTQVKAIFTDLKEQKVKINEGFSNFSSLFPEHKIPVIYTYISGFNQTFVSAPGMLGISLEKFLGPRNPLYDKVYPPLPEYQRRNMLPEKMHIDLMRAFISAEFEYKPEQDNLLAKMLHEARNMYLLKILIPNEADSLLWGFPAPKLDFCFQNEKFMWLYLIENRLLFESDHFRINQFIEDAPFTKDFQQSSPGRAAVWIGYRIVEAYMDRNSDVTIEKLMNETNFQNILNKARYNP